MRLKAEKRQQMVGDRKMFKKLGNIKIGTKITMMVALLMVVTLVAVGFISFNSASAAIIESYQQSMTTQATQSAKILSSGLDSVKAEMKNAAISMAGKVGYETIAKTALVEQVDKLGYAYLGLTNPNNATTSSTEEPLDLSQKSGFQKAMSGQAAIDSPEIWDRDGNLYFYAFTPVFGLENNVIAVLSAMIPYDGIYSFISSVRVGQTGYATTLDMAGNVTMHPVRDKVVNKENMLQAGGDDPKLADLRNLVQKCIVKETGFGEFTYVDGTSKYMSYSPVPGTDWSLLLTVPKSELFSLINQQMYMIIITSAVALVVIMAALLLFVRTQISRRLKTTANFARELASGKLDAKIKIKHNDEVGQLSSTLDHEVRSAFEAIEQSRIISEKKSRYQSEQVDRLVVNLDRLSKGELNCDMTVTETDGDTVELGELYERISDSLHLTVNTLKTYIGEISETLGAISSGDLSANVTGDFNGDFIALKESINSITESLSGVMHEINASAEQVAAGTKQVSDGSQEISQGATEQASAIEQLTASIEEIAAQTKQNAEKTKKALDLAAAAQAESATGNEQMKALQQAMTEINASSTSISKIIKVIDDIAFQTNILALNAAVEAARAGVHGKGFAVVAEEVRNLAARSANAAKETTELIESSVKKVGEGSRLADVTAKALTNILKGSEESAKFMNEIADASNQQATGISQVNHGIEQMAQVVQTNSATSEEAAAAAEELSSQAEMLKRMVGRFTLREQASAEYAVELTEYEEDETDKADGEDGAGAVKIALSDDEFGKY
jgi:X-X-X-Leu-X-X-Gly heptad repeat protein